MLNVSGLYLESACVALIAYLQLSLKWLWYTHMETREAHTDETLHNRLQGRVQDFSKGGGSILGLQAKKGGPGGSNFGPSVKKPT